MESTTIRISVEEAEFFLSCRRREKFCAGSAIDCKLSLEGKGVAEEHCEIERTGSSTFLIRRIDDHPTLVNGEENAETEVESPFLLKIGPYELTVELVPDEMAEGFEEIETETPVPDSDSEATSLTIEVDPIKDPGAGHRDQASEPSPQEIRPAPCAIPALRFGNPQSRTASRQRGKERRSSVSPVSAKTKPIPLAPEEEGRRGSPHHSQPSSPEKAPTAVFTIFSVLLVLLCIGGFGWFTWRTLSLPSDPDLLQARAEAGDTQAMATLGLSFLRGEWGCEFEQAKGIELIQSSADAGDPFGLLVLGDLRDRGFAVELSESNEPQALWRQAIGAGLLTEVAETLDARWIALAARAATEVNGAPGEELEILLRRAQVRQYPDVALVLRDRAESEEEGQEYFQKAIEQAVQASRLGSVYGSWLRASLELDERNKNRDVRYGRELMEKAAVEGYPEAQFHHALFLHEEGEEDALRWAGKASESGFAPAHALYADLLLRNPEVPGNTDKALGLATTASEEGVPRGFAVLARAFAEGIGLERNESNAIRLYREAVNLGWDQAYEPFGELLVEAGRSSDAIEPFREAAGNGSGSAALALGRLLMNRGEEGDFPEAVHWLETAYAQEVSGAGVFLANAADAASNPERDPDRAVAILSDLVEKGHSSASVRLSEYYLDGRGTDADPTRALVLLRKAADQGETSAFLPLARLYEQGVGSIPPSPSSAFEAYRSALESGDRRINERFPILEELPALLGQFYASWESNSWETTTSFLAPEVDIYLHLKNPDQIQLSALEEGWRNLWSIRKTTIAEVSNLELLGLNRIRVTVPTRLQLADVKRSLALAGAAVIEFEQQDDQTWKIDSFEENTEAVTQEPGAGWFEMREPGNSRMVFPSRPAEEAIFELSKLPRDAIESIKRFPLRDRFQNEHSALPLQFQDNLILFAHLYKEGEFLLPKSYFSGETLSRIETLADAQSFELYETLFASLINEPDESDPATMALLRAARSGDHDAEARVGEHYYDGLGTFPVNRVEALKWFVKSSRADHPLGRLWLAVMTTSGEISAKEKPLELFQDCFPDLAPLITRNTVGAHEWRAVAEGFAGGQEISLLARQPRDLLERAVEKGDLRAQLLLGRELLNRSPVDGVRYLRFAADGGCAIAATRLAQYYLGDGRDSRLAPALLEAAARKHDMEAQRLFASCYASGTGVDADPARAAFWLVLSLKNAEKFNNAEMKIRIRETRRQLIQSVADDHFRRAENFFLKKRL